MLYIVCRYEERMFYIVYISTCSSCIGCNRYDCLRSASIWKKCRFIGSYFRWCGTIIWETKSTWDGFNTSSWYGYYGYLYFLIIFYMCIYIVSLIMFLYYLH